MTNEPAMLAVPVVDRVDRQPHVLSLPTAAAFSKQIMPFTLDRISTPRRP
jgi:hypothetical protein